MGGDYTPGAGRGLAGDRSSRGCDRRYQPEKLDDRPHTLRGFDTKGSKLVKEGEPNTGSMRLMMYLPSTPVASSHD